MTGFESPDGGVSSNILIFFVNGKKVVEQHVDPEWTLLTYLRSHLRLTGAKLGCGEGGCGACTVMLSRYDHIRHTTRHYSVNACLTPVAAVHGMAVTTVEGIGSVKEGLHAVQDRLAKAHGSQCGFCTPGIVMSMYVLLRNKCLPSMEDIAQHLTGNLCRCTGYRAILDGFSSFTGEFSTKVCSAGVNCCKLKPGHEKAIQNGQGEIAQNGHGGVQNGQGEAQNGHGDIQNNNGEVQNGHAVKNGHGDVQNDHGGVQKGHEVNNYHGDVQNGHLEVKNGHRKGQNAHGESVQNGHEETVQNDHGKIIKNGHGEIVQNRNNDIKDIVRSLSQVEIKENEITENGKKEIANMNGKLSYGATAWAPYDPSQEIIFPPELKILSERLDGETLEFRGQRITYLRPISFPHLLYLKDRHPHAKIIVGNTEVGVEVAFKKKQYPVLINPTQVPQLTEVDVTESGIKFGAAVTLTDVHQTLTHQVNSLPEHLTRTLSAVLEMLKWFAGQQIRNTASIGGNIMTSSPISDLNPIFIVAGVTLTFASIDGGKREVEMNEHFFTGYRTNAAHSNEVLESVFLPYSKQNEFIKTYKQSRRRDDDIAIVNAAMKVEIQPDSCVLGRLRLAFGGMAATTITAPRTVKELVGCKWDESLLEKGINLLMEDLPLSASAPGGMVEYRRTLTLSLFFKFYLSVRRWLSKRVPQLIVPLSEDEASAITANHPCYSSSSQDYYRKEARKDGNYPVGQPLAHSSAFKQVSGEAVYVDDIPHREGELYAALVVSSRAHARILSIDDTDTLRMDGVEAFFSAKDLPGERNKMGVLVHDEEIFASEEVPCVGQVIGLVVAKNQTTARLAASKVTVEYQDLGTPIISIEDAIDNKSWWGPWTIKKGNLDTGFNTATHILEGEMRMGGQEHFYLEPNAHIAVPKGEDGEIEVFTSSQIPTGTQMQVAESLGVPANRVVVRVKRLGGAFGGKESRPLCASVPVAVAASRLQRPVRITLDRHEDMLVTAGRHPFLCRWRVGFTAEGILMALEVDLYSNAGCAFDVSSIIMHKAMFCIDNAYRHENIRVTGYVCKTHLPSNTAMRGFGAPQAAMFAEEIVSRIAAFLDLDPILVRERNLYKNGDVTHINHTLERCTVQRCWKQVIQQSHLEMRAPSVRRFNSENTYRKRGLSVTPTKCGIAFDRILNQAGALVQIYTDGSVLLTHGGVEMGQGLHTKMIQVASQILEIPPEVIHISDTATDKVPNSSPTAASISSDVYGMAVLNACTEMKRRLKPFVTSNPTGQWKDWIWAAYADRVSLSATGFYRIDEVTDFDFEKQCGQPFHYYTNGAAVTEVEIDCLTGDHTILRTDIVMDVGNSLNPALDIGQVEGAFIQGCGLVTLEELRYSPDGALLTRGPGAYKIPGFQDIPLEFHVSLLKDAPNPLAIFSSKGVGEPPLLLATSVFQAIKAAIGAARADQNLDPVFRLDSPATAERIRMGCGGPLLTKLSKKIESEVTSSEKPWSVTV